MLLNPCNNNFLRVLNERRKVSSGKLASAKAKVKPKRFYAGLKANGF